MQAILIQKCANGFLVSPPNITSTTQLTAFPEAVMTDATAAAAFIKYLHDQLSQNDPIVRELHAVRNELTGTDAGPTGDAGGQLP